MCLSSTEYVDVGPKPPGPRDGAVGDEPRPALQVLGDGRPGQGLDRGLPPQGALSLAPRPVQRRDGRVLLPYVELVDSLSWWESQATHWQVATAGVPGFSVYSNLFVVGGANEHGPYPRGRRPQEAGHAIRRVFGAAGLIPQPMARPDFQYPMGNCLNWPDGSLGTNLRAAYESPDHATANSSGAWAHSASFAKCAQALTPRFNAYLQTGDLNRIDGGPSTASLDA